MRKMKKLVTSVALALTLAVGAPTLLPVTTATVEAATIKMSKSKASVVNGKTFSLKLTGTKKKAYWYSDKSSIASVTQGGKVTGKSVGTTTIKAYLNGKDYKCKVTVTAKAGDRQKPFDATKNNTYTTSDGTFKSQLTEILTGDKALSLVESAESYFDKEDIPSGYHIVALKFKVKVTSGYDSTALSGYDVFYPGSLYNANATKNLESFDSIYLYGEYEGICRSNLELYNGGESDMWAVFIAPTSLKSFTHAVYDKNYNKVWTKFNIK